MIAKSKAELMRELCKRKRDEELRAGEEFCHFLRNTPFSSTTTEFEKFEAFLQLRTSHARTPVSAAERCKRYYELCKRKKLFASEEFSEYLRDTPLSSTTTDSEKFKAFLKSRTSNTPIRVSNAEKCKRYYESRKRKIEDQSKHEADEANRVDPILEPTRKICIDKRVAADNEFNRRFNENQFGVSCAVCDRLWLQRDMKHIPSKAVNLMREKYPNANLCSMRVYDTCYKCLLNKKIPRLATINGFRYPPFPSNLPTLDPVSERLVSPRLPFMQIHRLRFVHGSKGIVGQVINIPVDVNTMVSELSRQLDNDCAFNVHMKRHLIHKSTYLTGYVKKSVVKSWLRFLVAKPLAVSYERYLH